MTKSILILIIILFLCPMAPQAQAPQVQPPKPPDEPTPPLAVPKDYRYSARGRRDPFVNPVPKRVSTPGAPAGPNQPQCPQGLKGVMIAQATLSGIVVSKEPSMNIAVIGGPGGKTYFARVGDTLCDGVVKSIKLDAVTFVVNAGATAETPSREIVRELRPKPGETK